MRRLPYGLTNFEALVREDYYVFDKSAYIRTIEDQNSFILLTRPRRMGKSFFTNMLMAYYDINNKSIFNELFGKLEIGQRPTPLANKFLVIKFDFSHITNKLENIERDFSDYCYSRLRDFFERYKSYLSDEDKDAVLSRETVKGAFAELYNITQLKGYEVYIFVDEYDNFTNSVLASRGVEAHSAITHGEGFYRDFFKIFKGTFRRIFMTGVTPVSYDDLTSGFSIADVVSLEPQFNHAIGVTETELREMIEYYRNEGCIKRNTEEIIQEMKPWYDNFCFSEESCGKETTVYNTDMVLYYMNPVIQRDKAPKEMLDHAACTDTTKLDYLVKSEDLTNREERIKIIQEICAQGYTTGFIEKLFFASDVDKEENFKSMLFYFGTLTFGGWNEDGVPKLIVPNRNMGELYLKYMLKLTEDMGFKLNGRQKVLNEALREAAINGEWHPLSQVIDDLYHEYSSIRNSIRGEHDAQGFIRGLLCLNPFFDVWPELELNLGYNDILLIPKRNARVPAKFSYLIELKYLHSQDTNLSFIIQEAGAQLKKYSQDIHLKNSYLLNDTPLKTIFWILSPQRELVAGEL